MTLVLIDRPAEGIARLTLNQPEKRNPIGGAMRDALMPILRDLLADESVRAIVLTGAGGVFCAGGDVSTMKRMTPADGRKRMKSSHPFVRLMAEADKPIVAAVEGFCVGAGAGLAILCDTVVMGESAKFGIPFFKLGLVPDFGLLYNLPRRIGLGPARQLLLHGRMIDAAEAGRLHIADRVVPDADVQKVALDEARSLAQHPSFAFSLAKRMLDTVPPSLDVALEMEAMSQGLAFAGPDVDEGVAAFMEKRKPRF